MRFVVAPREEFVFGRHASLCQFYQVPSNEVTFSPMRLGENQCLHAEQYEIVSCSHLISLFAHLDLSQPHPRSLTRTVACLSARCLSARHRHVVEI